MDNTILPPHLEELKKILEKTRGKDGLSFYDIQKLNSLYEKWAKGDPKKPEDPEEEENLTPEEGLTRLERLWRGILGIGRVAWGIFGSLTGLRVITAALPFVQDRIKLRNVRAEQEALLTILSELEEAQINVASAKKKKKAETS
ncbi:hypothetical protein HYW94_03160, partial [Candidatus Uhrbacteria bacterium]|nr:hypothetical protein [Candidatus Uhrbacteria bacterium]